MADENMFVQIGDIFQPGAGRRKVMAPKPRGKARLFHRENGGKTLGMKGPLTGKNLI